MTRTPSRVRATVIIERQEGILLTAMSSGIYLLPGGAVEQRESPLVGAVRELEEETGLVADSALFLFEHHSHSNVHHVFLVRASGKPRARNEVKQLGYYSVGCTLHMSQGTRDILAKYDALKAKRPELQAALATPVTQQ